MDFGSIVVSDSYDCTYAHPVLSVFNSVGVMVVAATVQRNDVTAILVGVRSLR